MLCYDIYCMLVYMTNWFSIVSVFFVCTFLLAVKSIPVIEIIITILQRAVAKTKRAWLSLLTACLLLQMALNCILYPMHWILIAGSCHPSLSPGDVLSLSVSANNTSVSQSVSLRFVYLSVDPFWHFQMSDMSGSSCHANSIAGLQPYSQSYEYICIYFFFANFQPRLLQGCEKGHVARWGNCFGKKLLKVLCDYSPCATILMTALDFLFYKKPFTFPLLSTNLFSGAQLTRVEKLISKQVFFWVIQRFETS